MSTKITTPSTPRTQAPSPLTTTLKNKSASPQIPETLNGHIAIDTRELSHVPHHLTRNHDKLPGLKSWDLEFSRDIFKTYGKNFKCYICLEVGRQTLDGVANGKARIRCRSFSSSKYIYDKIYVKDIENLFFSMYKIPNLLQYKSYYTTNLTAAPIDLTHDYVSPTNNLDSSINEDSIHSILSPTPLRQPLNDTHPLTTPSRLYNSEKDYPDYEPHSPQPHTNSSLSHNNVTNTSYLDHTLSNSIPNTNTSNTPYLNHKNVDTRATNILEQDNQTKNPGQQAILQLMKYTAKWSKQGIEVPEDFQDHVSHLTADICSLDNKETSQHMLHSLLGILKSMDSMLGATYPTPTNTTQQQQGTPTAKTYAEQVRTHLPNHPQKQQQMPTRPSSTTRKDFHTIDEEKAERMSAGLKARTNELNTLFIKGLEHHRYFELRQYLTMCGIDIRCVPEMTWAPQGILEILVWSSHTEEVRSKLNGRGNGNIVVNSDIQNLIPRPNNVLDFWRSMQVRLERRLTTMLPHTRGVRYMTKKRIEEIAARINSLKPEQTTTFETNTTVLGGARTASPGKL
jgi:hypothetical protein